MEILDLRSLDERHQQQAAHLLVIGFRELCPNAWPTIDHALEEVQSALNQEKICRAAVSKNDEVIGWIGGIPEYSGNAWELHPLIVNPEYQNHGIGTLLVRDLEEQVRRAGAITIFLGTDDESNMTSLAGIDLYPDVVDHIAQMKNVRHHPYEFYQKLGYTVVGIIPDANGFGKPDIIMAKRIRNDAE